MSLAITPKKSKKGGGTDVADKFSKVTNIPSHLFVLLMTNTCVSDTLLSRPAPPPLVPTVHVFVCRLWHDSPRRTLLFEYTQTMRVSKLSSAVWGSFT